MTTLAPSQLSGDLGKGCGLQRSTATTRSQLRSVPSLGLSLLPIKLDDAPHRLEQFVLARPTGGLHHSWGRPASADTLI